MTSDLPSVLEVCFKQDTLNKSMFTLLLLYFTFRELTIPQVDVLFVCVCLTVQQSVDESVVSGEAIRTQLNISQQKQTDQAVSQKKKKGKKK